MEENEVVMMEEEAEPSPAPEATASEEVQGTLEEIQTVIDHPLLSTPFEDYTVLEGYALLIFLALVVCILIKAVKGAFSWL